IGSDRKTATEVNALAGLMSQQTDMRARVFRLGLGELYRQCWGLLKQYNIKELQFYHQETIGMLDQQALKIDYIITPSGSADGINKPLQFQKAVARMNMFRGHPNIHQDQLVMSVIEVDDPRLIKRLVRTDAEIAQQTQAAQAMQMGLHQPPMVKPA